MGTTTVGRLWYKGKCLTKQDIWLNQLKYTKHEIENYVCKINDEEKPKIDTEDGQRIVYLKYSGIAQMEKDTYIDILKAREEIARINVLISLAKNVEVMEKLEEELHYKKAYIGDIEDDDFDGETLENEKKITDYMLNIIEYVAEQEEIDKEDIIMTIETY